jgi:hypothetical protein
MIWELNTGSGYKDWKLSTVVVAHRERRKNDVKREKEV